MNVKTKNTIHEGVIPVKTDHQTEVKESKMKVTSAKVIRWSGLAAMGAGIIFIVIQPIHPPDVLASVTTSTWGIVEMLKFSMAILGMLGVAGIYARQVNKAGWLGLAGYLMLSTFYALTMIFSFIEVFVMPLLATEAPKFVEDLLGLAFGNYSPNIGAIGGLYMLAGMMFLFGGLLLGIATFRAGVLPRWAGALLVFGAVSPPLLSLIIPHPYNRVLAAPIGLAIAWLGCALLTERREKTSESVPVMRSTQPAQSMTK